MVLIVAAIVAVAVAKMFFGVRTFAVLTGSMTPAIEPGDLVFTVPTEFDDIQAGDVITFVLNEDLDVATHRVASKDVQAQTIVTKGDANAQTDGSPVLYGNVVGVVRLVIPKAGFVLSFLSSATGKIVTVTVVLALAIICALVNVITSGPGMSGGAPTGHDGE
jgi:signal peptidase